MKSVESRMPGLPVPHTITRMNSAAVDQRVFSADQPYHLSLISNTTGAATHIMTAAPVPPGPSSWLSLSVRAMTKNVKTSHFHHTAPL